MDKNQHRRSNISKLMPEREVISGVFVNEPRMLLQIVDKGATSLRVTVRQRAVKTAHQTAGRVQGDVVTLGETLKLHGPKSMDIVSVVTHPTTGQASTTVPEQLTTTVRHSPESISGLRTRDPILQFSVQFVAGDVFHVTLDAVNIESAVDWSLVGAFLLRLPYRARWLSIRTDVLWHDWSHRTHDRKALCPTDLYELAFETKLDGPPNWVEINESEDEATHPVG